MIKTFKEIWQWSIFTKAGQMVGVGCFLMGLGFGFWHALGCIGLVIYYRSWDE